MISPSSPLNMEEEEGKKLEIERDQDLEDQLPAAEIQHQPWTEQITVRGLLVSMMIGIIYSIIVMKLNLTTGMVPNLNASAALLAFVFVRSWTKLLHKAGFVSKPFSRQENTIIQTCAVACYSIAVGGIEGNNPNAIKEPGLGWMTGFLFVVCFVGLFVLIPLRKVMIVDLKLPYPSGLATAVLINGFHTQGDKMAKKQVRGFMKYFSISFLWGLFKWFFSGIEDCGFEQFPTFGLKAWKQTFYFDFSMTFVGAGMICSHLVNLSLLLGAVLSFGVMYPLIDRLKGNWFPDNLEESNMKGLYGYKVFLSIALIIGDGMYNFIKILISTVLSVLERMKNKDQKNGLRQGNPNGDLKQTETFIREGIPMWLGVIGYAVFTVISIIVIPHMFPQLKWYYVVVAYIFAPSLAFCNAYGAGLTDINMAYNYGKVALFVLAAMTGKENGVVAGLVGCGLFKSVISVSCILMQDFKTAHYTYTSPRAMFICQVIGTAIGCVTTPLSFFLYYKAFDVGNPNGEFKAPYALIYRNMAVIGVQGSLVVFVLQKLNTKKAELMAPAIASGLICGEGLWTLPAAILALAKINPPICMKFVAS
ncbi:Oligopeptide transporter, OPT superfamily [Sesbania bispinosa]|nr:Oligopeptide transporter, OPT superfamily [Sesbania bispinosa]